jgi:hypothetical protein
MTPNPTTILRMQAGLIAVLALAGIALWAVLVATAPSSFVEVATTTHGEKR